MCVKKWVKWNKLARAALRRGGDEEGQKLQCRLGGGGGSVTDTQKNMKVKHAARNRYTVLCHHHNALNILVVPSVSTTKVKKSSNPLGLLFSLSKDISYNNVKEYQIQDLFHSYLFFLIQNISRYMKCPQFIFLLFLLSTLLALLSTLLLSSWTPAVVALTWAAAGSRIKSGIISGLKKWTNRRQTKTPAFKLRIYGVVLLPMPKYYVSI